MSLLVVTALPFEARDLAKTIGGARRELGRGWIQSGALDGEPVSLAVTGPGRRRVDAAADALPAPPSVLISAGVAGALRDDLGAGWVVLADSVRRYGAPPHDTDDALLRRAKAALGESALSWRIGGCLGVDEVLVSEASKRRAARQSGCAVVQMEDHVWAERSEQWGAPFLSLRVVLDAVDHALPEAAMQFPWRGPSAWAVARVLAGRPAQIPALLALSRSQTRARRALSRALHAVAGALSRDAATS